jgi:hypothetical protein
MAEVLASSSPENVAIHDANQAMKAKIISHFTHGHPAGF